ncbi:MAG: chromate efflux transporter, partial [Bacteroidetes bacterium]|nr:chromate efflux transporter [Bacteroidota bacterium]
MRRIIEKYKRLIELTKVFSKLGLITFGGPAVHIALFEDEVVSKRKWMSHQHFLDLVGATNLIPGPNSTEMALHTGYHRAGIAGLIVAGICFTLPAVLITGIFAFIYAAYGNLPDVKPLLYGMKPAVIVIIINAVYKLGSKAIKGWKLIAIAVAVASVNAFGVNEVISILLGGGIGALFIYLSENKNVLNSLSPITIISFFAIASTSAGIENSQISLTKIFLTCLKIGAVWFGGGYILVAYFDGEFVQGLHWLTRQELLDAIAVGQFTPGPFLSSATFIGYQIAGIGGAAAATIGILIPSFIFVLLLNPIVPKLRKSKFLSHFLDAVNVSALAVMFVVAVKLGAEVLIDPSVGINWRATVITILSV